MTNVVRLPVRCPVTAGWKRRGRPRRYKHNGVWVNPNADGSIESDKRWFAQNPTRQFRVRPARNDAECTRGLNLLERQLRPGSKIPAWARPIVLVMKTVNGVFVHFHRRVIITPTPPADNDDAILGRRI
jgi:hypothetical protein